MGENKESLLHENEYILPGNQPGYWSICAVVNPNNWHDTQSADAHWLNLTFDGREWVAVFCDTLGMFNFAIEGRTPAFDHERRMAELSRRSTESFARATAQYLMLGRLSDTLEDVSYKQEEISQLREECLQARVTATNPEAVKALNTLVSACDKAMKLKFGLFFACP